MENSTIFFAYLTVWIAYVLALHTMCRRKKLPQGIAIISHLVPSVIAILMIGIFVIGSGGTIAQLVSGSNSGMNMWRLWFYLWPLLLCASALSSLAHLVWIATAGFVSAQRKWIPISASGLLMSIFAFFTVSSNFPDA